MPQKILIVDDDVDSLKLIGLMLKRQGYQVSAASTGGQALSKVASDSPDLVILDVMMPDMNGYEVCRRLRANTTTRHIPIIMFTAKTLIDDKVAGFEAGADDYLTKPTHPAELVARVESILQRFPQSETKGQTAGRLVGLLGVKGGVGVSTLAVNLGIAAQQHGQQSIVVDFRLGASTMGQLIGVKQPGPIASLLSGPTDSIHADSLAQNIVTHRSGTRFLLAAPRPREAQNGIRAESLTVLLGALRGLGDPVVIDLGSTITHMTQQVIDEANLLILLTGTQPTSLSATRHLLDVLSPKDRHLHIVVTQQPAIQAQPTSWQAIEAAVGHEVRAVLTMEPELAHRAEESGQPILAMAPDSIFSTQVKKLVQSLSLDVPSPA